MEKILEINSLDELDMVARAVLDSLDGRSVVAFDAPMGAGKTTLISRIAAQLGAEDDVTSPTFAIVISSKLYYNFCIAKIQHFLEICIQYLTFCLHCLNSHNLCRLLSREGMIAGDTFG